MGHVEEALLLEVQAVCLEVDGALQDGHLQKVRVGLLLSASHSGMYVADAKGFFEEQGIEIETTKGS